jgi:hypothetical protein
MAYNTSWLTGAWYRGGAALARHRLAWRRPGYRHEVQRWLVLQAGANPSTDYYIRPRAAASGIDTVYRDIEHDIPSAEDLQEGTHVVIVRYLSRPWAEALRAHAERLAQVVYFMDDDLLDPSAWEGLPRDYHDKLAQHFGTAGQAIAALTSQLWVSTPELAARYAQHEPIVVPPLPLVDDAPRAARDDALLHADDGFVRMFYHGTRSHEAEIRWLHPIVAACLEACPQAHFEIIGDYEVNRLYRGLPRTRVLHPMSWPNYVAHSRTMRGHIGLVPLLEGSFNAGRSYTKVFDVARCGGVGVYSKGPYDAAVHHGHDGILLPTDPHEWITCIRNLLSDTLSRQSFRAYVMPAFSSSEHE